MKKKRLGSLVRYFLVDYLRIQKGLRPATIRSYRDVLRLYLLFMAADCKHKITKLSIEDLTFDGLLKFLQHLEQKRGNNIRTRNQRLAVLHGFFEYLGSQIPEMLDVAEKVASIPMKRVSLPETQFLEKEDIRDLFDSLPTNGRYSFRNRVLLLFLYNTGARVQEVADLQWAHLELADLPRVRLHGKGDKWRNCPLWKETANYLKKLRLQQPSKTTLESPVFTSGFGNALTRFGIYKIVRRLTTKLEDKRHHSMKGHISPHVFRHTTAVHLLESGVDVNVIRGWLGHVSLDSTNRYAEINMRTKEAALRLCEPPLNDSEGFPAEPVWRDDENLLSWLNSL